MTTPSFPQSQPDPMDSALPSIFSAEAYFATQPPPSGLEHDVARVREFVQRQRQDGRKTVLVTVCLSSLPAM